MKFQSLFCWTGHTRGPVLEVPYSAGSVSILVLLDRAHPPYGDSLAFVPIMGFNPCSAGPGTPARNLDPARVAAGRFQSLFCWTGHTRSRLDGRTRLLRQVSILVLLDRAHPRVARRVVSGSDAVSILVLLDRAHPLASTRQPAKQWNSFNPCSAGPGTPASSSTSGPVAVKPGFNPCSAEPGLPTKQPPAVA